MNVTTRIIFLSLTTACLNTAFAQTARTWKGDTTLDDDWSNNANWTLGAQAQATTNLTINVGSSAEHPVVLNDSSADYGFVGTFLGRYAGNEGHLLMRAGKITFVNNAVQIGGEGNGSFVVEGTGVVEKLQGAVNIGVSAGGVGRLTLREGGEFRFMSSGSTHMQVGGGDGRGVLNLHGGVLKHMSNARINVAIANATMGTGLVDMRGGTITARESSSASELRIGFTGPEAGTGRGMLQGWGTIDMTRAMAPGNAGFNLGGAAVGDGTGLDGIIRDETLDISAFKSAPNAGTTGINVSENTPGMTHHGWYTRNRGAIRLHAIVSEVGSTNVFWGGENHTSAAEYTVGANTSKVPVNGLHLRRIAATNNVTLQISMLDPTRETTTKNTPLPANNSGLRFLTLWQIDALNGAVAFDRFYQRYDEGWNTINAPVRGSTLVGLAMWDTATQSWLDLRKQCAIDDTNYLVNLNLDTPLVVPENGTALLALTAGYPGSLMLVK